ncbi:amidohydrolase [Flaviaesturariibacter amylovorans]|uniref:Nitrilase family protein n=1 Tax=Flaviaesturariibacter amylovorans TaxID=1084520 RepID=A0ABP8HTV8_9BACT
MSLPVTLIQAALHWEDRAANLLAFEEKIRAHSQPGQVVVLPEMFSTGFSMRPEALAEEMNGPTVQWMKDTARAQRIILTGSLMIKEGDRYFNRALWVLPNGTIGQYDKRHLFAYAGEHEHYTPGRERLIASVNGWRVQLQVCYDLRFPVWSRQQVHRGEAAAPEYDVLLYVANWPERRNGAWKTLLQARAIENQCYVIGVNRVGEDGNGIYHSGDSMVVDPMGDVLYHKAHEEDVFSITLDKAHLEAVRQKLPFWKDADDFSLPV